MLKKTLEPVLWVIFFKLQLFKADDVRKYYECRPIHIYINWCTHSQIMYVCHQEVRTPSKATHLSLPL